MIKLANLNLPLGYTDKTIKIAAAKRLSCDINEIKSIKLLKLSLDARKKSHIHYVAAVAAEVHNEQILLKTGNYEKYTLFSPLTIPAANLPKRPVIAGFGPAGIFAALTLARVGANPIVLERGQDADARRKKNDIFISGGELDENCNIQFGEGGAGAFSDGKLSTGISSPLIIQILHDLVQHGAPPEILYQAKPHIGTDRLLPTVKNLREEIKSLGGEIIFGAKLTDIGAVGNRLTSVTYEKQEQAFQIETDNLILAVGHSARDTFKLLLDKGIELTPKPFSVGMRIEHLQADLNRSMYGENVPLDLLPPADYRLAVHLENGRGVYTFCMCPGGSVVASSSEKETIVTNGMSCHARDGKNANSAILVGITPADFPDTTPLGGFALQRKIEQAAYALTNTYQAPYTTVGTLLGKTSDTAYGKVLPTYRPGVFYSDPREYLPDYAVFSIKQALPLFAKKISCFADPEAVLTGPETRSSSPVRLTRDDTLQSVSLKGLYPCGEGAGYAGGIMSAAVDGVKCAMAILEK